MSTNANIGEAAGAIWKTLNAKGPLSKEQLCKTAGLSTDLANQGIGWLAREDKICISQDSYGRQMLKLKG